MSGFGSEYKCVGFGWVGLLALIFINGRIFWVLEPPSLSLGHARQSRTRLAATCPSAWLSHALWSLDHPIPSHCPHLSHYHVTVLVHLPTPNSYLASSNNSQLVHQQGSNILVGEEGNWQLAMEKARGKGRDPSQEFDREQALVEIAGAVD
ncbi:hypothetical protein V6N12_071958 [Hibiscus sabdariffa]|uniref:Uncharacterized protein n=1 Tax=Hibiscus sabdariffa TaxID=183260 RepID=A0ABR2FLB5_9ROSI